MDICREIEIPVPWGHIAGKLWGDSSGGRPLLALHGRQDNCGVFDRIIPSLSGNYYAFAMDLPGHGLSSHYPAGVPLFLFDDLIAIVCVLKHFEWERVLILGHSWGAQLGFFFAAVCPEHVEKIIAIDPVGLYAPAPSATDIVREYVEEFLKLDRKLKTGDEPTHPYEQMVQKLTNRWSTLTREAAEIVLRRSLKKQGNGDYSFRMDQRLKLNSTPLFSEQHLHDLASNVRCPRLCIISSESFPFYKMAFADYLVSLGKISEIVVDGNHDFHQNHPEKVVDVIDEFFANEKSKL